MKLNKNFEDEIEEKFLRRNFVEEIKYEIVWQKGVGGIEKSGPPVHRGPLQKFSGGRYPEVFPYIFHWRNKANCPNCLSPISLL